MLEGLSLGSLIFGLKLIFIKLIISQSNWKKFCICYIHSLQQNSLSNLLCITVYENVWIINFNLIWLVLFYSLNSIILIHFKQAHWPTFTLRLSLFSAFFSTLFPPCSSLSVPHISQSHCHFSPKHASLFLMPSGQSPKSFYNFFMIPFPYYPSQGRLNLIFAKHTLLQLSTFLCIFR